MTALLRAFSFHSALLLMMRLLKQEPEVSAQPTKKKDNLAAILMFKLRIIKVVIETMIFQQGVVVSFFYDLTVFHDQDHISFLYG